MNRVTSVRLSAWLIVGLFSAATGAAQATRRTGPAGADL